MQFMVIRKADADSSIDQCERRGLGSRVPDQVFYFARGANKSFPPVTG